MAATATALKTVPLSEQEAINIVSRMPMLVAMSNTVIEAGQIVVSAYEVDSDGRTFTFPAQPFRVMRKITREEYLATLSNKRMRKRNVILRQHFYEIHTD